MFKLDFLAPVLFLVMWSSGAVVVKLGLQFSSQWSFLALRALLSLLCITLIVLVAKTLTGQVWKKPNRTQLRLVLQVGLLLQVSYLASYILAIDAGLAPGLVTLVLGLQPLLTPLCTQHKLSRSKLMLLLGGFVGLSVAIFGAQDLTNVGWKGLAWAVLALLSLTFGTIKQAKVEIAPLPAMFYQCLLSCLVFTLLSFATGWQVMWQPELVFSLLWMSGVVSVGALLLLMTMIKRNSADQVSVLFYAIPIFTYLFDHWIFGTSISALTLCGTFIVAMCIVLYRRQPKTSPARDKLLALDQGEH
ncbi:DMT family transporter [Vibrio sp. JPW-9-11-11]|uniref:DMT family transporter n=1 Tax=Vibrio sp. JPW-9-11-11 TaxID=1416532 RepID=UPI00159438E0|nr:DMT family transporter [Vibrio sp. JPW-9-11-11]NVD05932.1 DMT family transporter [Vibrio sp. JPW-9-11-11]